MRPRRLVGLRTYAPADLHPCQPFRMVLLLSEKQTYLPRMTEPTETWQDRSAARLAACLPTSRKVPTVVCAKPLGPLAQVQRSKADGAKAATSRFSGIAGLWPPLLATDELAATRYRF